MAKQTVIKGLLAGCLLWLGNVASVWAAPPTVAEMLTLKPGFDDVQITTPAPEEYASCEVKLVTSSRAGSSGWLLLDAKKQPLRRFFDGNGDKKIDMWSYYKDGQEVFREIDSNFNGSADQFRWLNSAGMKWGVSSGENGKIDYWRMISSQEAAQEAFQALATNDFRRMQALFLSEAEMRAMKLPAAQAQQCLALQKGAADKFQTTRGKLSGLDKNAKLLRVEPALEQCVPADSIGTDQDLIKFQGREMLFETGDKKHDWVVTGEMIQVGMAWRLIDVPGPREDPQPSNENPELRKLLDVLAKHDADNNNQAQSPPKKDKAVQDYFLKRVEIVQQLLKVADAKDRENWIKQMFDNLSSGTQAGSDLAQKQLAALRQQIENNMPGSNLAAYGVYRELWAVYAPKIDDTVPAGKLVKMQEEWHDKLTKFVQAYPKSEDTADALYQLAMGCEFTGKDEESRRWYKQIYSNFPGHYLAEKARGSERRLNLIGQKLELAGPHLGTGAQFDIGQLKDKVVVVYYWAGYVSSSERDFDTLKRLCATHAKDLELVCVNLDDNAEAAAISLKKAQVPGAIHLFQAANQGAGLNSPLATYYGISGLPTLFLVGRDGRVISRTLQVSDLDSELKKAL